MVGQVREPILGALALGDVEQESLPEERRAVRGAHLHGAVEHPHDAAVARDQPVLLLEYRPLLAARRRERFDPLAIVLVQDGREERAAVSHPLLRRVAEHRLDVRADVRHPALERVHVRADGHVLDELAVAPLGRPQLLLGALALGDVARQARVEERVCDRARDDVGKGAEELDLVAGELVPLVVADPHHADRLAAGHERGHQRRAGVGLDHLGLVRLQDALGDVGVGLDGRRAAAEGDEAPGLAVVSLERHGMRAGERGRAQSDLTQNVIEVETGSELSRQVEERVQPARGSHAGSIGRGFGRLEHYRTRLRWSPSLGAGRTRCPRRARSRLQSQQKGSNPASGGAVSTAFGPVPPAPGAGETFGAQAEGDPSLESWQSLALIAGAVALLVVDLVVLRPSTIRGAAAVTAVWTAAALASRSSSASPRGPGRAVSTWWATSSSAACRSTTRSSSSSPWPHSPCRSRCELGPWAGRSPRRSRFGVSSSSLGRRYSRPPSGRSISSRRS